MSVLPLGSGRHLAAELMGEGLHPVADSQHGQPAFEDVGRRQGGVFLVDAGGPAGQDKTLGIKGSYAFPGSIVGKNLAEDLALSHPAGDEHAVLGTEVQHHHCFQLLLRLAGLLLSRCEARLYLAAGDLEVGGYLHIVGGGYSSAFGLGFLLCQGPSTGILDLRLAPMIYSVKAPEKQFSTGNRCPCYRSMTPFYIVPWRC